MKWVPTSLSSDEMGQNHGFSLGKIYYDFNENGYTEVFILNIKIYYWTAMGPGPVRIAGPTSVAQPVHCADLGRNPTQNPSGPLFAGKAIALPPK